MFSQYLFVIINQYVIEQFLLQLLRTMRSRKQEHERHMTEGEDLPFSKPQTIKIQLNSGLTLQFGKPLKLPFIQINNQNTQLSSRTNKNTSFLSSFRNLSSIHRLERGTLGETVDMRHFNMSPDEKHIIDNSLNSLRISSNRKISKYLKPKVKKVFPQSYQSSSRQLTKKLTSNQYKVIGKIGQGNYAKVYKVVSRDEVFATKIYLKQNIKNTESLDNIRNEIEALKKISCDLIIRFHDTFETQTSINIITQYFEGQTLFSFIKSNGSKLSKIEKKHIFKQLITAVSYIHKKNIFHRDIKLQNILINPNLDIKLIDFGFATQETGKIAQMFGTRSYMAPQIVLKKPYLAKQTDIWSCGVILFKLLVGTLPFKGVNQKLLQQKIVLGKYKLPTDLDPEGKQLIRMMLVVDPSSRINANEIDFETIIFTTMNPSEQIMSFFKKLINSFFLFMQYLPLFETCVNQCISHLFLLLKSLFVQKQNGTNNCS